MGTVQQFPVQGNPTTAPAATLAGVLRRAVDTKVGPEASFAEREAAALALANDATRQFLQDDLMARVDRHSEHIEVDGACYKRPELGTVRYYTLCGVLDLERWTYRAMGVHNGPTVVPLELEAGLVERTTPALGLRIMLGYAKDHMRSAEEDMKADHRCPPSRSTRPYVRTPPAPVTVHYRMAYVGTVSFHDAEGTELATRHYSAAAHEAPTDRLVRPMLADLRHALQQGPTLAVGVVQDGAPELWRLLSAAVVAEPLVTRDYEAIDRYHLNERLADLLRGLAPDAAARTAQLSRWNDSLDRNDQAIYRIRAWVRDQHAAALTQNDRPRLDQIEPHLTYLENNASLMRYARLRAVGIPVGSGVTEGACKSVVKMRTNGSGQRWRPTGLTAVLTLRALHQSDRLPRFWAHFARRYRKEVMPLCA